MADKKTTAKYYFKCELIYVDTVNNKSTEIESQNIKAFKIDHNYASNHMPVLLMTLSLDKKVVDDMITNKNENLFSFTVTKYNCLVTSPLEVNYFKNRFTYFISDELNKNDAIDYANDEQTNQQSQRTVTIGLMCIDHINDNKKSCSMSVNGTKYDYIKYITSHMDKVLIEPFNYNETLTNFVIPAIDSISALLTYVNDYRVFYKTSYRYYIDFDCTYIISSSGKADTKKKDKYDSVTIKIEDVISEEANDEGMVINKTKGSHTITVSYADTEVYDNTIINKSKDEIKGITSTGNTKKTLKSTSNISKGKTKSIRIKNDNDNMMNNIISDANSSNVFIALTKYHIDPSVFTINKRYVIKNIDRYKDNDGAYLLTRKIEDYERKEDGEYWLNLALYFRKVD
jgi:hypothetical protein